MKVHSRSKVVSSFTLIKGAMIDETYRVFAIWDLDRTKRENLDRLRDENLVGAGSATWLRDVAKVLNRRFDPAGRDRALVVLAKHGCDIEEWKPILLWHITRDEFLLRDFLTNWLFSAFDTGVFRVRPHDLHSYLRDIGKRGGTTEHDWTEATLERVATALLRFAADFGLLRHGSTRTFASYHVPERSFLYLLHAVRDAEVSPQKLLSSTDWRMFLMRPDDVERELLRLHQFRRLEYHVAGSLVQLSLPCSSALEYAERMVA